MLNNCGFKQCIGEWYEYEGKIHIYFSQVFYLCFKFHIAFCVLRLQGYNLMDIILAENG